MNLVAAFVRNPVKVAVGVLLVALFGLISLARMPMQLTPEVVRPTIQIETWWPGASPQEVEREIVQEQEEQLKGVEGVRKMSSESMDSRAVVTLEFAVGTDMKEALLKVNTRLQQVPQYPVDAREPVISAAGAADQAIGWFILRPRLPSPEELRAYAAEHPDRAEALAPAIRAHSLGLRHRRLLTAIEAHPDLEELLPARIDVTKLQRFAEDTVEARFERVAGVSNSNVYGGREEEVQVVVDPQRLAARQITIGQLRQALVSRNQDTSGGDFWEGKRRYVVRTMGQFTSLEEVEEVIVARRDGAPVYVRDVAEVRRGHKKPGGIARSFGMTSLAINCIRETGANVLDVMEGLYAATRELNEGVLGQNGLALEQVYDETDYIHSAVGLVQQNIYIGGVLTILALLLFLRSTRSTLVIALAIPTSIVGTFLLLHLMGRSLNVVSLAGLAFAVGMLVDNAVVVLENVYRHYQGGARRRDAAVKGTAEVWGAVVASTLTTLAVFLPVLFVQEEAGQLFRDIALAISCAVGLSLVVSVTLIPTASARVLPSHEHGARPAPAFVRALGRPFDAFGRGFVRVVLAAHRWLERGALRQLALAAVLVGAAGLLTWRLFPKVEYLPTGNRNLVIGFVFPPPGYNLDEMLAVGRSIEERLRPYWDVDPGSEEAARLDGPAIDHFFVVAWGRQLFLGARTFDPLRAHELVPIVQRAAYGMPGTFAIAFQSSLFQSIGDTGRRIDVEISGPELPGIIERAGRMMGTLMALAQPQIPDPAGNPLTGTLAIPRPSLDLSSPEVHVVPKWEQAADLGLTARDLGYAVDSLVDGAYAGDFFVGGDKIDLTIVGQERFAGRFQDLEELPVATPSGQLVPLRAVAEVRLSSGPEQINHRERLRTITLEVRPPETKALEEAVDVIRAWVIDPMRADGSLAEGYDVHLSGTADKLVATWEALRFNVLLALLISYLLLAALFESWLYPFVIILSVPLGAVGGILGLWVLNLFVYQPLDVVTMLGFIILIGTVVNNAILIVHQALVHMREEGLGLRESVLAGVRARIRPIFMTVTTTVFALLPLVVFPGAGSELYRGLGSVLIGGLVVSTIFTLFLVPTVFRLTLGLKRHLVRWLGA